MQDAIGLMKCNTPKKFQKCILNVSFFETSCLWKTKSRLYRLKLCHVRALIQATPVQWQHHLSSLQIIKLFIFQYSIFHTRRLKRLDKFGNSQTTDSEGSKYLNSVQSQEVPLKLESSMRRCLNVQLNGKTERDYTW